MHDRRILKNVIAAGIGISMLLGSVLHSSAAAEEPVAAPNAAQPNTAPPAAEKSKISLSTEQDAVAIRFKRFEKTLLQMAEYMRKSDPERADLLIRAIGKSKEGRIALQMERIVSLLGNDKPQFGDAVQRQDELIGQLQTLLDLLQSEDRISEIEKERERIKALLKDVNKLIGKEKDVRAATERGGDAKRLTDKQGDVEKQAGDLIDKISDQDDQKNNNSKSPGTPKADDGKQAGENPDDKDGKKNEDGQPNDKDGKKPDKDGKQPQDDEKSGKQDDPQSGKESDGKPQDGKSQDGKPQDGKQAEGEPSESEPQPGQPQSGQPQQGQQQQQQKQQQTPGREELEQSREQMQKAIEQLEKEARDEASKHQDEAIAKLREAKEKLEEILRQLREEEQKILLAALEARFQKMLGMQLMVYNDTLRLDQTPEAERDSRHVSLTIKLARDEEAISLEAAKALTILREEGSSVAFPEAVEQLQVDMLDITRRLERSKVGAITQGLEKEVIEALEEMVETLQREMEKKQNEQQQGDQQQQQGEDDKDLVDVLAELKMLRSLQVRVNRQTKRWGEQIEGEQATAEEIVAALQKLSKRQSSLQQATYNIVTGRNK